MLLEAGAAADGPLTALARRLSRLHMHGFNETTVILVRSTKKLQSHCCWSLSSWLCMSYPERGPSGFLTAVHLDEVEYNPSYRAFWLGKTSATWLMPAEGLRPCSWATSQQCRWPLPEQFWEAGERLLSWDKRHAACDVEGKTTDFKLSMPI